MDLLDAGSKLLTLIVLESVLSFDNAAILAAMSRRLPLGEGRRRALNYGMAIAYVLRLLAILGVFILLRYEWLLTIGGLYLAILWLKHTWGLLVHREEKDDEGQPRQKVVPAAKARFGMSPLTFTVLQIGVVNLAFSLDQIVAAVAITQDKILIIVAAAIGVGSLRLVAPYLSRMMDWLPILEDMAYIAVGFVGCLLVLEHPLVFQSPHAGLEFIRPYKVPITLALFVIPIAIKVLFNVPKSHGPHHATIEESMREAARPTPTVEALRTAIQESHGPHVTEINQKGKPTLATMESASEDAAATLARPQGRARRAPAKPKGGKAGKPAKPRSGAKR